MFPVRNDNFLITTPAFWTWFDEKRGALSERKVAKIAHVAHSVISKARNGSKISHSSLAKIATALGEKVSTVYGLVGHLEEDEALSPKKAEFLANFDDLHDDDQEEILAIMRVMKKRNQNAKKKTNL